MPRASNNSFVTHFIPLRDMPEERPMEDPTWRQVHSAAIENENPVYAAYESMSEPQWKPAPGFDLLAEAKKRNVPPERYVTVLSPEELDFRIAKNQRQQRNRETLEAAGWAGTLASVYAGVLSPTTLMPFLRGATGMQAVLGGAASVVSGAAIDEAYLQKNQDERTTGETVFALTASTIIGGLLGAVAHTMSKSVVDKIAHDMVNSTKELTILPPPKGSTAGAAEFSTIEDVGAMKKGWGADKLAFLSPITRGFQQWNAPAYISDLGGSAQLRKMTAGFSQAGLALRDNAKFKAAVAGGNVEDLKRTYAAVSYGARKAIDDSYIEYILGAGAKGFAKKTRALVQGYRADGKLTYDEFKRQITLDIWSNFTREGVDPTVRKAAKAIDETVYKKMYDEGVEVGLFTGEEKTVGDENYANRVYNNEVIMRRHDEFVSILAKNYAKHLNEQFSKGYEKLRERMAKDKVALEDAQRPLDEVLALREEIKAQAETLEKNTSLDVLEGIDTIKGLKNQVRALTAELEELKKVKTGADIEGLRKRQDRMAEIEAQIKAKAAQAEDTKKALGEGLENYTKAVSEIRRRLAGLNRAHSMQDVRMQKKLEKIEANEDAQVTTILRAQKQLQKFLKMLDSATDEKLDTELSKFKDKFNDNLERLERLEEQKVKLETDGYGGPSIEEIITEPAADLEAGSLRARFAGGPGATGTDIEPGSLRARFAGGPREGAADIEAGSLREQFAGGPRRQADDIEPGSMREQFARGPRAAAADVAPGSLRDQFAVGPTGAPRAADDIEAGSLRERMAAGPGERPRPTTGEDPAFRLADRMDSIEGNLNKLSEKIDELESLDRSAWRAEVEDMMRELADTHARINAKRAVRNEKLWKQVENYSPEARAKRLEEMKLKAASRPKDFMERWNTKAEGDLLNGVADFSKIAKERAEETVKKILGTDRRLAYSDIIQQERGAELARVLNIPSEEIADFLETDIEHLVAIYTRTVGSDLSIARVFGRADAAEEFQKLDAEKNAMLEKIEGLTDKKGNPLSKEEKEDLSRKTYAFYEAGRRDLLVLLERAKGVRGLPKDPDAYSSRAAKTIMDINYLRFMGGVVLNSIADVARPIMRHGLTRTFRDGIIPMVRAFRTIRMSQREAKLAGTALDAVMHTRAMAMMDMFDDTYRGTAVEKGIHYLSTRMGTIALFDQWTSAMKQFSAGIVNARLLDSIAIVNGEKASAKEIRKAQEFLAKNNIDAEIAQTIWREVTNGKGGGKVNGVWLPNTEDWNVADPNVARARRAYRAALAQEVDSTIITPGFERPNWVDMNLPARMLAQFKSFGFASTQKTLMAGLQEHDAAFLNGVVLSLGLGVVSYILWAKATGGEAEEKMLAALADLDGEGWKTLADEGITRSGILGVFADVQKVAHRVPVLRQYASFSGAESTRRAGGDLTESLLGPSYDLLEQAGKVITGIDEPTKATLHAARLMMPFQNIFYLRQLLDKVEDSIDLPERRTKQ